MIYHRAYEANEQYEELQTRKARTIPIKLLLRSQKRQRHFQKRFTLYKPHMLPGAVLCMGARTGCEVKVLRKMGFNATGIDLYPLDPIVVKGDWSRTEFLNQSFSNIYSNSLDHCRNISELAFEIHRLLVPGGRFIFESHTEYALNARKDRELILESLAKNKLSKHPLNAMFWDDLKDIADVFIELGYTIRMSTKAKKYSGYVLRK